MEFLKQSRMRLMRMLGPQHVEVRLQASERFSKELEARVQTWEHFAHQLEARVQEVERDITSVPFRTGTIGLVLREIEERLTISDGRLNTLEHRLLNYHKFRWDAVDKFADYLVVAEVPGDYIEFGVAQGLTFAYAFRVMAPLFSAMRFIAADSFQGLPEPIGVDAEQGYRSNFFKGQFAYSEDEFFAYIKQCGVDVGRVVTLPGWFDETLPRAEAFGVAQEHKIALAWIDCDLYESTRPVLKFIVDKLSVGSVVFFDDWRCFRNQKNYGQQRACGEWLAETPGLKLNEFIEVGGGGKAFTVARCPGG